MKRPIFRRKIDSPGETPMTTVTLEEAQAKLPELIDHLAAGDGQGADL